QTNKIDRHCSFPCAVKVIDRKLLPDFHALGASWAIGKLVGDGLGLAGRRGKSRLRPMTHCWSSGRRTIRTALEKTKTSCPCWFTPRNLLPMRPHCRLEVSRFDT